ncbi:MULTISPECIES: hypothetical protein [unclassified Variovorax]|uniref:hypothetical protein n=1 Tax=unclassified Variovorax TaxID=663243 RepID=UPI0008C436C1|nr:MULTISPECIES: hypothetical protein [unclassified Variovorax]SEK17216.1 hypothetical protein SAMN05518853_13824 [Variovorax sp. OK202]SFD16329.1 hypothetical protein SAMN05444746_10524 [Variovorax sp. OK212]
MKFPSTLRTSLAAAMAVAIAAALWLPVGAQAQSADNPPKAQRAHTLKSPSRRGTVVGSVERGTDPAGRGVNRADAATRRGVNHVSEKASRPVRNVGEAIGRRLSPGSSGRTAPPATGPQGNAP